MARFIKLHEMEMCWARSNEHPSVESYDALIGAKAKTDITYVNVDNIGLVEKHELEVWEIDGQKFGNGITYWRRQLGVLRRVPCWRLRTNLTTRKRGIINDCILYLYASIEDDLPSMLAKEN